MTRSIKKTKLVKTQDWGMHASLLLCPSCGSFYLHHSKITAFDRGEDSTTAVRIEVLNGQIAVNPLDRGDANPSLRRDGVTIDFWCEGCGSEPITLTIGQHKGMTEIGWVHAA